MTTPVRVTGGAAGVGRAIAERPGSDGRMAALHPPDRVGTGGEVTCRPGPASSTARSFRSTGGRSALGADPEVA